MEKKNYIKIGFLFYIGYTFAKELDMRYRTKIITSIKNFLKTKEV